MRGFYLHYSSRRYPYPRCFNNRKYSVDFVCYINQAMGPQIRILDGGMSRELMRLNAPFKQPEWSAQALIEAPHMVQQVHREFAEAGADIITTDSYALVPFHIGEERFWNQGGDLAALAGQVARAAANEIRSKTGRRVLVAGSLPPIFGSYRPDLFRADDVAEYLAVLVTALAPYVDVWLGETLSLLSEAEAVFSAVYGLNQPIWISFNLTDDGEGKATASSPETPCLRSGETVADATRRICDNMNVKALLFNCNRPEVMDRAIQEAKAVLDKHDRQIDIGVYANAFEPSSDDYAANENISSIRTDLDIQTYATTARQWVNSGATIVGGCCGIGVEHIRALAVQLKDE